MDDDFSVDTLELIQCAKVNFENAGRMIPGLKDHPIFVMASEQLSAAVKRLEDLDI